MQVTRMIKYALRVFVLILNNKERTLVLGNVTCDENAIKGLLLFQGQESENQYQTSRCCYASSKNTILAQNISHGFDN